MVSHNNYYQNASEGFEIFLTSKLITCFIDGFTSTMNFQLKAYLFNESEHIYWIWDLKAEVHSIWVIWTNGLLKCNGNFFSEVVWSGHGALTSSGQ